jgi:ATPase family associated with various cellular activities (AAA)
VQSENPVVSYSSHDATQAAKPWIVSEIWSGISDDDPRIYDPVRFPGRKMGRFLVPPRMHTLSDYTENELRTKFTDRFVNAFLKAEWGSPEYTHLTDEEVALVEAGKECPKCHDTKTYWVTQACKNSGVPVQFPYNCPCITVRQITALWNQLVSPRWRHVRLHTLEPVGEPINALPIKLQEWLIATLIENDKNAIPANYLFTGEAGTGKTHFAMALLRRAVMRWAAARKVNPKLDAQSVFYVNAKELLDQHHRKVMNVDDLAVPEPVVTGPKLRRLGSAGYSISLFIDEIDKITLSEFKMGVLLDLVNSLYEYRDKCQIVAISNKPLLSLRKVWQPYEAGEAIIRRICMPEAGGFHFGFHVE